MKPLMNQRASTAFTEVATLEERYQLATYKKMNIAAERGESVWIYTSEGEKYLDHMAATVAGTGHHIRTWWRPSDAGSETSLLFNRFTRSARPLKTGFCGPAGTNQGLLL